MTGIFILLGSNLGDRMSNLKQALNHIAAIAQIIETSSVYKTAAWGKTDQPYFMNQVIRIETSLSPELLLSALLDIEKQMGRERIVKWGERLIDLDILFYQDEVIQTNHLTIPHPQLENRRFTLVPLAELAGEQTHPVLNNTINTLLDVCSDPLSAEEVTP
ncbi:MAG TPA: 2-amino-4-hydroxy-6-hydroxymethyldihydropteridine diphosphokinase [Ohtaekwangia sp.]|nr:2-amino-4-hydroxy-6-hydroxymethyldihydropteridine diphosphokinase [Ohtaekwangia sp.]